MENLGFHKSKLYSLILAGVALISLLLPWISVSAGGFGGASKNGFGGWGLLVLLGIGAVAAACFMGNKALGFDDRFIRKWNYYLNYCEAAFEMRNINVMQMVYTRPNNTER